MSENRTSQAVETASKGFTSHLLQWKNVRAVCEKYKKMEAALRVLSKVNDGQGSNGTDDYVRGVAEEALEFDPLK